MIRNMEILQGNYWEHFKFAKDLALILPLDHPKRVALEKELNEMVAMINHKEVKIWKK